MAVSTPKIDEIRARLLKIRVLGPLGGGARDNGHRNYPRIQCRVACTGPHVTKPYEFIGFGAMDVTKPYEFIGFGAMDGASGGPARERRVLPEERHLASVSAALARRLGPIGADRGQ